MFTPPHFKVSDRSEVLSFIVENAFGQLISTVDGQLFSTHLPFLLSDDSASLIGHLARLNPQLADIDDQEVLVTLPGPHDYISPSWYQGSGVPTWNYQAVHIRGRCTVFDDAKQLQKVVNRLSEKYESRLPDPWEPSYPEQMLRAIKGVTIEISSIECTYKLSQNKPRADRENVIEKLREQGNTALADAMHRALVADINKSERD